MCVCVYRFFTVFLIFAFFLSGYPAYASNNSVKSTSVIRPFSSGFLRSNYNNLCFFKIK